VIVIVETDFVPTGTTMGSDK